MIAAGMGHGANPTRGRYKTDADALACARLLADAGADTFVAGSAIFGQKDYASVITAIRSGPSGSTFCRS